MGRVFCPCLNWQQWRHARNREAQLMAVVGQMKTALARFGVGIPFKAIFSSMTPGT
jgi:hypothetical protein